MGTNEVKIHDPGAQDVSIGTVTVDLDAGDDSVMIGAQTAGASGRFFQVAATAVAPAWGAAITFGFRTQGIMILNEGDEAVEVSFDGISVDTELGAAGAVDAGKAFDNRHETKVHIRSATGGKTVTVEAW